MRYRTKPVDATDISHVPELVRLADEVRATRKPKSLRVADEEVGILLPPRRTAPERPPTAGRPAWRYLREDDTFWDIVGMSAAEDGPTDVSANKYRYLAEAYLRKAE
jgi:hypothetical protein